MGQSSTSAIGGGSRGRSPEQNRQIVRQSCLKAAADFLGAMSATHEDVKSEHIMVLAAKFEEWVYRDD
jgi:hypothetical protein